MAFLLGISGPLVHMLARFGTRGYTEIYSRIGPNGPQALAGSGPPVGRNRVQEQGVRNGAYGADKFGFKNLAEVRWNLTEPTLYEYAVSAGEASLVAGGALCAETGHHTGRSPKDKHTCLLYTSDAADD